MSKVFSVRLADDLAARVEEIATARGVRPPSVIKAAVEGYVGGCSRGLPDPPRPVARSVRVDTPSQVQRWALERQAKLNEAKGGAK